MREDVAFDGRHERGHTLKAVTADPFVGDFAEPALDLIEPGGAGGSEVQMVARPFPEPGGDPRCLVRAVVVQHQVHVETGGDIVIDLVEEAEEFLVTVARVAVR